MPRPVVLYVRYVDAISRGIGWVAMFLIFAMMGILLFSTISRAVFNTPHVWVVEMSQFTMAAYYLLGGAYSMILNSHVRMDLFYSRWSPRRQAGTDVVTSGFLIFYLVVLLIGAISSTEYALTYDQRNYSSWAPKLWPIKVIMTFGIFLMLLQTISTFFKDLARARGETLA